MLDWRRSYLVSSMFVCLGRHVWQQRCVRLATVCLRNLLAVIMSMRRQEESGEKVRNQENSWECGSGIRRKSEESDEHVARRLPHIAVLADMQPFPQRRQSTVTLPVRPRSRNRARLRSVLEYFRSWKDLRRPCQRYDTEVEGKQ